MFQLKLQNIISVGLLISAYTYSSIYSILSLWMSFFLLWNIYALCMIAYIKTALTDLLVHLHAVYVLRFGAAELQWEFINVRQGLFRRAAVWGGSIDRAHFTFCFVRITANHHRRAGINTYNHCSALWRSKKERVRHRGFLGFSGYCKSIFRFMLRLS